MQGLSRMASIRASGTRTLPTFLLSLSTYTGRDGSKCRSASHTKLSKRFWLGCSWPGMWPSTELRWLASASRSSTCAPWAASACSRRVLPLPVGPQTTRQCSRVARPGMDATRAARQAL